jgi:tetratricopeptide (TPR) repeat protein
VNPAPLAVGAAGCDKSAMVFLSPSQPLTLAQRFNAARAAYEGNRPAEAVRLLQPLIQAEPRSAPAQHLFGLSLLALGDLAAAETALRASLASDKKRPAVLVSLAEVLHRAGRTAESEKTFRAALAIERRYVPGVRGLAELLLSQQRHAEALQLTTPIVAGADAPPPVLDLHAEALRRGGRLDEALATLERSIAAGSQPALLEMASQLRDLGRYEEAEAAARKALELIGDHPVVLTVLGRMLQDLGRLDEADAAYRKALTLDALDPVAHQALADLVWTRTADPEKAWTPLDSVLRQRPTPMLIALKAKMLTRAGRPQEAYGLLADAARNAPDDPLTQAAAATAAVHAGEIEAGVLHAERAVLLAPDVARISALLAETALAAGDPDRASQIAAELLAHQPFDQQFISLQALAWRLLGDERYRGLYDYDAMVQGVVIEPPQGWSSLEAFLADLASTLKGMHAMRGDPLDQSLRNGTQTEQNLALSKDPVIQAFFGAVDAPIRAYVASLGKGRDPLRARSRPGYRVKGAWSAYLLPGGFHADHMHPDGWLSSAFYVELPKAVEDNGREGWIKFGQPGAPTQPALEAEHFVKPLPGKLVLFPSYMWHGTVPFSGEEKRLTMAFDVVPT